MVLFCDVPDHLGGSVRAIEVGEITSNNVGWRPKPPHHKSHDPKEWDEKKEPHRVHPKMNPRIMPQMTIQSIDPSLLWNQ